MTGHPGGVSRSTFGSRKTWAGGTVGRLWPGICWITHARWARGLNAETSRMTVGDPDPTTAEDIEVLARDIRP